MTLSTYQVPGTVPGAGHAAEDKAAKTPALQAFKFYWGWQIINHKQKMNNTFHRVRNTTIK